MGLKTGNEAEAANRKGGMSDCEWERGKAAAAPICRVARTATNQRELQSIAERQEVLAWKPSGHDEGGL